MTGASSNFWDMFRMNQNMLLSVVRKVMGGRKFAGVIRSLVNVRELQFECVKVLQETMLCLFCCMAIRQ